VRIILEEDRAMVGLILGHADSVVDRAEDIEEPSKDSHDLVGPDSSSIVLLSLSEGVCLREARHLDNSLSLVVDC